MDDLDQVKVALRLPAEATIDDVIRQASGLVASIVDLRRKVYTGLIDPVLRAHGVEL